MRFVVRNSAVAAVLASIPLSAFAAVPVSGGSLTVNPTPVAPAPAPLPTPVQASGRSASADPLAGSLPNGVASPLTAGPAVVCRPIRHVAHRRVVRRFARPPVVVAAVPPPVLVPVYPVVPYRPVYVARPVVVYRPTAVFYGRPYPYALRTPFFYGPRPFFRRYDRPVW